jgi:hypothetical protein
VRRYRPTQQPKSRRWQPSPPPRLDGQSLCNRLKYASNRRPLFGYDPVDLGAQSDLIGAPESVSTEAVLAAPIG